jgi:hypothetical protein
MICGPLAGNIGVYVYQVKGRQVGSFYTENDAKNYAARLNQYSLQMLLPVMQDAANVKDHRARFY